MVSLLRGWVFQSPFGDSMGITCMECVVCEVGSVSIPFRGFHGDNEVHTGPGKIHRFVSIPFRGFHGDNLHRDPAAAAQGVSIPFRGFHGDNAASRRRCICVFVSIPFRGFHGDNTPHAVHICTASGFQSPFGDSMGITEVPDIDVTSLRCFNPLSGIPWG